MKVIGLTGGIASGKSTVSKFLQKENIPVFDADKVAAEATEKGSSCYKAIIAAFGKKIVSSSGDIDRKALAAIVFKDKAELKKLEKLTHGYVWKKAEKFLQENKTAKMVVLDMPLLIECGWASRVEEVWLVALDKEEQIKRAMLRSNMTREEVIARIDAQMPLEEKKKYATIILDNSKDVEHLEKQIIAALK